ncbi:MULTISPECIES: lipoprotein insertase outer membrane protein LolB [unclassified Oceanobacter]|uniref:lipoprotein insertase outer membrane protein LolB n=1 Tax=unclassified Oceanobacter TaxID=2620260 RepID=UPI002733AC56|nr:MULTISPECIES: lipoprotein insertase outer membrane protein LolB [unclassified Oceanobacter]MDP2609989.1 lipoprotein insertase outer membrane protein LolB [Oceanobacter sp. 1_MG-2023]MDP2613259.1 lipoprotein insertase outer membrane protein LolB [Oceanobacter sp. 2_MG-2023]
MISNPILMAHAAPHVRSRWVVPLFLLFVSALSSCSLLPGDQQLQQRQLNQLQHWQLRGKLSVTTQNDSVTGYLTWQQDQQQYDLFITGPMGQGSSRLEGNQHNATLTLPNHDQPLTAANAESLMADHLGWYLPVSGIRYWVKGQPAPDGDATSQFDDYGLLSHLQQNGWTLRFSRYQQQQGIWLPGLIKIQGYHYSLTLAINEWTLYD